MTLRESRDTIKSSFPSPAGNDDQDLTGCTPNISKQERKKRLLFGLFTFGVSLFALTLLVIIGADRVWRLATFFLFFGAAVGFFQWRDKT